MLRHRCCPDPWILPKNLPNTRKLADLGQSATKLGTIFTPTN